MAVARMAAALALFALACVAAASDAEPVATQARLRGADEVGLAEEAVATQANLRGADEVGVAEEAVARQADLAGADEVGVAEEAPPKASDEEPVATQANLRGADEVGVAEEAVPPGVPDSPAAANATGDGDAHALGDGQVFCTCKGTVRGTLYCVQDYYNLMLCYPNCPALCSRAGMEYQACNNARTITWLKRLRYSYQECS